MQHLGKVKIFAHSLSHSLENVSCEHIF